MQKWVVIGGVSVVVIVVMVIILILMRNHDSSNYTGFKWVASDPAPDTCSEPCGTGKAYRKVECFAFKNGQVIAPAPDTRCDASQKPPDSVDCNTQACAWVIGPWSNCVTAAGVPVTCGRDATHTRTVTCPREESACGTPKPPTEESCDGILPFCDWGTTPWLPDCATYVCGTGEQTRTASCGRAPDSNCDPNAKPAPTQTCDTGNVCTWVPQTQWYPYPVPYPDMFNPASHTPTGTVSLVLATEQKTLGVVLPGTKPGPITEGRTGTTSTTIPYVLRDKKYPASPYIMYFPTLSVDLSTSARVINNVDNPSGTPDATTLSLVYDNTKNDLSFGVGLDTPTIIALVVTDPATTNTITWTFSNTATARYFPLGYTY